MIHGRVRQVGGNELTNYIFLLISIVHQVDVALVTCNRQQDNQGRMEGVSRVSENPV